MTRTLDAYLHDRKAGQLVQSENGQLAFTYDVDYVAESGPPISVSMPLRQEIYDDGTVRPYFSGLLPDERARSRLAAALGVSPGNAFGLLEIIGGECAGALSLIPEGADLPDPSSDEPESLDEERLARLLATLRERTLLGGEEGVRLSLAGFQDKLAVRVADGLIALPRNGHPTTHILKPFIAGLEGTVENEVFCMRLAARMGLDAPAVTKATAGGIDFILVERYDRLREKNGVIRKLHQDDFCQALAIPPELKYEDEGGPGITRCQNLIQRHTARPAADRLVFQKMLIFHYLVGNADAHAKNCSLLYRSPTPELAPLYDVVCTAAYPRLSRNLAMKIGGRAVPDTLQLEHWHTIVLPTTPARRMLSATLRHMAQAIGPEADRLLEEMDAEGIHHPILKIIRRIIATRASHVMRVTEKME